MVSNTLKFFCNILLFVIVLALNDNCSLTKINFRGTYCNVWNDDSLSVIITRKHFIGISGDHDTIAICNYKSVSNKFIEIYNDNPHDIVKTSISYTCQDICEDSIKISFFIPYCEKGRLRISLKDMDNNDLSFICYRNNNSISFTSNHFHNPIIFTLEPYHLSDISTIDNEYKGVTHIDLLIPFEPLSKNHYYFYIPSLKDDFWQKYYTPGSFIRIDNDTLIWDSQRFIRLP